MQRQPLLQNRGAPARRFTCASSRRWPPAHPMPSGAQPPMVMRAQICRRDLPRESWTTVHARINSAHNASGPCRHLAQRRVLRRLSGTHGRSRLRRPPQRRAFHQRTTALRHLSRLARGDPDHLFRQDHVLERGPSGTPGLEHESAARLTGDAAPTSAGIDAGTGSPRDCDCFDATLNTTLAPGGIIGHQLVVFWCEDQVRHLRARAPHGPPMREPAARAEGRFSTFGPFRRRLRRHILSSSTESAPKSHSSVIVPLPLSIMTFAGSSASANRTASAIASSRTGKSARG